MGTSISTNQEGDALTVSIKWDGVNTPLTTAQEDNSGLNKSTPETDTVLAQRVESPSAIPTAAPKKTPVKRTSKKPAAETGNLPAMGPKTDALSKIKSELKERPSVVSAPPVEKISQDKSTPIAEPTPEKSKKFSMIPKVIKDQWKEGGYKDELKDENASKRKSIVRKLVSAATNDNPFALRAFDHYTTKKNSTEVKETPKLADPVENFSRKLPTLSDSVPASAPESKPVSKAEAAKKDPAIPLLDQIFHKLDEIKTVILKTGAASSNRTAKLMGSLSPKLRGIGGSNRVIRPASPTNKFSRPSYQYKKPPVPTMMEMAKAKEIVPLAQLKSPIANSVATAVASPESAGPGILDAVAGQSGKGLAGRLLPQIARFALPAAAVAASGYGGYKAGEWINEKMDGTPVGEVRDSASQSMIAMIDKATGGMLSPNKEIADELYKETDVGKLTTSVSDKFSKTKNAAVDSLTGLYGKSKNAATNITQTVPALVDELDSQGIAPTLKQKAMVLGQLAHETGGFSKMEEGKYSADSVWKLRGPQLEKMGVTKAQLDADEKSKGKDSMYEYMYADKYRDKSSRLGNDQEGDAAKYKGRGLTQLTGKSNYARVGKELGVDLVAEPDLITKDPKINAKVTANYLKNNKIVSQGLASGDIKKVSQGINGGAYGKTNGEADRILQTQKIESKLEKAMSPTPYSNQLEKTAIETATKANQPAQPIVIQSGSGSSGEHLVSNQQPAPTIMARNPDSSIQRITEGQMSYGIA